MYGDASPTSIAVKKKKKLLFPTPHPKTSRRQSHCFQGRTLLIPNLQWLYRAVFAADLMTGCIIKPYLWTPLLEVRKARLKHPYIVPLRLLLLRSCAFMLSDTLSVKVPAPSLRQQRCVKPTVSCGKCWNALIRGESPCASGEVSVFCFPA